MGEREVGNSGVGKRGRMEQGLSSVGGGGGGEVRWWESWVWGGRQD